MKLSLRLEANADALHAIAENTRAKMTRGLLRALAEDTRDAAREVAQMELDARRERDGFGLMGRGA